MRKKKANNKKPVNKRPRPPKGKDNEDKKKNKK